MFHSASSMANVRIVDKATDGGASNYHLLGMTAPDAYIEWTINAVQLSKVALQATAVTVSVSDPAVLDAHKKKHQMRM